MKSPGCLIIGSAKVVCLTRSMLVMGALVMSGYGQAISQTHHEPILAGYVYSHQDALPSKTIDADSVNRIYYAFANIRNGAMVEGSTFDAKNIAQLTALRKKNPSLQVLISVGGWSWSGAFSNIAMAQSSRTRFVASVVDFIHRYDLDGVDLDWEYPGMPGAGHIHRSVDKQNFTLLLRDIRKALDEDEKKTHHKLYLTIAAGASEEYLEHVEMDKAQVYLDEINLMSYDYSMPGDEPATNHHAPLYTSSLSPESGSLDSSVRAYEKVGVPAHKLIAGLPFYSHAWVTTSSASHGLYQKGRASKLDFASFASVETTMIGHGFKRYWDEKASAPYLFNDATSTFVSYEDKESVAAKCDYVRAQHLGGMMFWEYGGDPGGELIRLMHEKLLKPKTKADAGESKR